VGAATPEEGAAGTADDPYAFMPKPEDNNVVSGQAGFGGFVVLGGGCIVSASGNCTLSLSDNNAAAAAAAAAPEEGAAGTADDPYAVMPKPEDNNVVRGLAVIVSGLWSCTF
jgi:hypothetical protein